LPRIDCVLATSQRCPGPAQQDCHSPQLVDALSTYSVIDRDYETLRIGMQIPFDDLGITPIAATTQ
jgi:hypothetical protein